MSEPAFTPEQEARIRELIADAIDAVGKELGETLERAAAASAALHETVLFTPLDGKPRRLKFTRAVAMPGSQQPSRPPEGQSDA